MNPCWMFIGSTPAEKPSEKSPTKNKFLISNLIALSLLFCCHAILPAHSLPVFISISLILSLLGMDVSWESEDWRCQGLKLIWSEPSQMWCQSFNQEGDGTTRGTLTDVHFILKWHWITHLKFTKEIHSPTELIYSITFGGSERLVDWKSHLINNY